MSVYCTWEKRIKFIMDNSCVEGIYGSLKWAKSCGSVPLTPPPKIYFLTQLIFKKARINSLGRLNSANWTVGCWVFGCRWLLLVEAALKDIFTLRAANLAQSFDFCAKCIQISLIFVFGSFSLVLNLDDTAALATDWFSLLTESGVSAIRINENWTEHGHETKRLQARLGSLRSSLRAVQSNRIIGNVTTLNGIETWHS